MKEIERKNKHKKKIIFPHNSDKPASAMRIGGSVKSRVGWVIHSTKHYYFHAKLASTRMFTLVNIFLACHSGDLFFFLPQKT